MNLCYWTWRCMIIPKCRLYKYLGWWLEIFDPILPQTCGVHISKRKSDFILSQLFSVQSKNCSGKILNAINVYVWIKINDYLATTILWKQKYLASTNRNTSTQKHQILHEKPSGIERIWHQSKVAATNMVAWGVSV